MGACGRAGAQNESCGRLNCPVQERVAQLAVADLVCQCEHGLRARLDAAVQEAPERLQGLADIGRCAQDALDPVALDA